MIRKPIITVLGHVDHGKTTFLDRIRGTSVASREAGAITQHIGATEVPIKVVKDLAGSLMQQYKFDLQITGLLFIDTPGHEAFTNLRKRGGSIADLAVVIIDINQGVQPQTIEAIDILRTFKVPFIVGLNKIDKMPGWNPSYGSITNGLKLQSESLLNALDTKLYGVVGKLYEMGFQAERFDRVADFTKQIPIIPISSKLGEGLPEMLLFLAGLSQKFLEKKLTIHVEGPGKGTILEVKEERGLGKTIDVILYDGSLKVGDEIVLGGKNGVIKTKVRALLEPKPLNEMNDSKEKFNNVKEVHAASGVKIAGPNLDDALAGSPLLVASDGSEEQCISDELKSLKIEQESVGPIIRTDALGSLEALVKLASEKGLKPRNADVGDVSRKDILEAAAVSQSDRFKGVILAFNVKVNSDAEKQARLSNVKIFKGNVIYRILEEFDQWVKTEKDAEKQARLKNLVWPSKIQLLPNHVFRNSKPAIAGVRVLCGRLKVNALLMKPNGERVGKVLAIQSNNESVETAQANQEVAVSIEDAVIGRGLEEKDELVVFLSENTIKALEKIRDDLSEDEIELINEMKKINLKRGDNK
ncbi:MAG: translation initiation factor IF-2 [Candidatus Micrarchaeota archaeon]